MFYVDTELKAGPDHVEDQDIHRNGDDYAPDEIQRAVDQLREPTNAAENKRYLRKLDLIILPAITLLYFLEYLDR